MSIRVMALVWDSNLRSMERLVLLAYADHADHDGNNVYPSLGTIARKTGLSRRSVMRIRTRLEDAGIMVATARNDREPTCFRIAKERIASDAPSLSKPRDTASLGTQTTPPRDTVSPKPSENRHSDDDDAHKDDEKARTEKLEILGITPPTLTKLTRQLRSVTPADFEAAWQRIANDMLAAQDGDPKMSKIRSWPAYAVSVFRELAGVTR